MVVNTTLGYGATTWPDVDIFWWAICAQPLLVKLKGQFQQLDPSQAEQAPTLFIRRKPRWHRHSGHWGVFRSGICREYVPTRLNIPTLIQLRKLSDYSMKSSMEYVLYIYCIMYDIQTDFPPGIIIWILPVFHPYSRSENDNIVWWPLIFRPRKSLVFHTIFIW